MSGGGHETRSTAAVDRLRAVVWGKDDRRVRATWRVALAWPVLWFLVGSAAVLVGDVIVPTGASLPVNMLLFGLIQGFFVAVALVAWARYLDRRPVADYGLSASGSWLLDLVAGFGAVVVAFGVWLGVGSALGWSTVELSMTAPRGSLVLGLGAVFVGVVVNVWVQETVFVGVVVTNAAEGLSRRGLGLSAAVVGAWVVAVLLFTAKHRPAELDRLLNLGLALGVFGLLYVHTGELALSIGVHTGVNYAGNALFVSPSLGVERPSMFHVTNSLSGLPGSLSEGAIPPILLAYLLLVGWIAWRNGGWRIVADRDAWRDG